MYAGNNHTRVWSTVGEAGGSCSGWVMRPPRLPSLQTAPLSSWLNISNSFWWSDGGGISFLFRCVSISSTYPRQSVGQSVELCSHQGYLPCKMHPSPPVKIFTIFFFFCGAMEVVHHFFFPSIYTNLCRANLCRCTLHRHLKKSHIPHCSALTYSLICGFSKRVQSLLLTATSLQPPLSFSRSDPWSIL